MEVFPRGRKVLNVQVEFVPLDVRLSGAESVARGHEILLEHGAIAVAVEGALVARREVTNDRVPRLSALQLLGGGRPVIMPVAS